MIKAQVQYHFPVNNLYVTSELLGTTHRMERNGRGVYLTLPLSDYDFGLQAADDSLWALGFGLYNKNDALLSRSVLLLRITVDVELPDGAGEQNPPREIVDEVHGRLRDAADVARSALSDYLALARTRGNQYWLSHSAEAPAVSWMTNVIETNSGRQLLFGYDDPTDLFVISYELALSTEMHQELMNALADNTKPDIAESLLSDAQFLAWTSKPPQYRESMLLAAIAAEIRIKICLEQICPAEGKSILYFALRNPRDVSVQAVSLYDKAASAVINRSLRKENPEVYKSLVRLFEKRNAVAHRAEAIEQTEAKEGLNAAELAIRWADNLLDKTT